MKKVIVALMLSMLSISFAFSQTTPITMDVNGLKFNNKYTDAQIGQALGEFKSENVAVVYGPQLRFVYPVAEDYLINRFEFNDDKGFCGFLILSPDFKLYDGQVKIGDNVSVFKNLKGGLLQKEKSNTYKFFNNSEGKPEGKHLLVMTSSDGVITQLRWVIR